MTPREHIRSIMAGQPTDRPGFWLGKPHPDTLLKFQEVLGTSDLDAIQSLLGDDVRWITPQHDPHCYRHPEGKSMRPWRDANPHGLTGQGLLSDATSLADLDRIEFPDARYLDFSATLARLDATGPHYRLGGMWAPFFHDLCYLFGTEELLCLILEAPDLVKTATERICTFYLEANDRLYALAADRLDAHFFGNDFGTQNGLLISPELFREFFLPWIARFAAQARSHGLDCILHSCGGIADIIEDLIAAGINGLHPLQSIARGMNPETLAPRFASRITFWGGVDTQHLLQDGTPDQVRDEVHRLDRLFAHRIVIGPSHEALLPSVNLQNVLEIPRTLEKSQISNLKSQISNPPLPPMNHQKHILVVGSYAAGLVMQTSRLPGPGETLLGHSFRSTHGGKGSNQAVQAARLGATTAFLCRVGRDSYGDSCEALHRGEGVDTSLILRDDTLPTGVGFIVVDDAGRNLITLDMGANAALTPALLEQHAPAFASARVVLAQLEIPLETALAAMRLGRQTGAITLLNPAPAADLTAADLSNIDYLIPNEHEARVCAGLPTGAPLEDAIAILLRSGCRNVLVTLGEAGCTLRSADGTRLDVPGFRVQAVDTVGAGDAFCGAFATALSESQPIEQALRFANVAAALSVTKADTIPSYHHRAEVEKLLPS